MDVLKYYTPHTQGWDMFLLILYFFMSFGDYTHIFFPIQILHFVYSLMGLVTTVKSNFN